MLGNTQQIDLEVYSGPYLEYAETRNPTALWVWPDWVEDNIDPPPTDAMVAMRTVISPPPGLNPGASLYQAARYVLPPPGAGSTGWEQFPFCAEAAASTFWRGRAVTVWLTDGLPQRVSAPVTWLDPFRTGSRLWWMLERYPWLEVDLVLRRVHADVHKAGDEGRYYFLRADSGPPEKRIDEGYVPPVVWGNYDALGKSFWGSAADAQAALGRAVRDNCLERIRSSGVQCPASRVSYV